MVSVSLLSHNNRIDKRDAKIEPSRDEIGEVAVVGAVLVAKS